MKLIVEIKVVTNLNQQDPKSNRYDSINGYRWKVV